MFFIIFFEHPGLTAAHPGLSYFRPTALVEGVRVGIAAGRWAVAAVPGLTAAHPGLSYFRPTALVERLFVK